MEQTIRDKAASILVDKLSRAYNERNKSEFIIGEIHVALQILNGERGYYLCPETPDMPERGQTAFEEIVDSIGEPLIHVSLEPIKAMFGQVVFEVSPLNGMMN